MYPGSPNSGKVSGSGAIAGSVDDYNEAVDHSMLTFLEGPLRSWNSVINLYIRLKQVLGQSRDSNLSEAPHIFELLQSIRAVGRRMADVIFCAVRYTVHNSRLCKNLLMVYVARVYGYTTLEILGQRQYDLDPEHLEIISPVSSALEHYITNVKEAVDHIEAEVELQMDALGMSRRRSTPFRRPYVLNHIVETAYDSNSSSTSSSTASMIYRTLEEFLAKRKLHLDSEMKHIRNSSRDMMSLKEDREVRQEREHLEEEILLVEDLQRLLRWLSQSQSCDLLPTMTNTKSGVSERLILADFVNEFMRNVSSLISLLSTPLMYHCFTPSRQSSSGAGVSNENHVDRPNITATATHESNHDIPSEFLDGSSARASPGGSMYSSGLNRERDIPSKALRRPTSASEDRKTWNDFERVVSDMSREAVYQQMGRLSRPSSRNIGSNNGAFVNISRSASTSNNLMTQEQQTRGSAFVQHQIQSPFGRYGRSTSNRRMDEVGTRDSTTPIEYANDDDWVTTIRRGLVPYRDLEGAPRTMRNASTPLVNRVRVQQSEAERLEEQLHRRYDLSNLSYPDPDTEDENNQYAFNWLSNVNVNRTVGIDRRRGHQPNIPHATTIHDEEGHNSNRIGENLRDLIRICQEMLQVHLRNEDVMLRMVTSMSATHVEVMQLRNELMRHRRTATANSSRQLWSSGSRNTEESYRNVEVPPKMNVLGSSSNCRTANLLENLSLSGEREDNNGMQNQILNNQLPPGNRANNFYDNFKSYSRQNMLSTSKTNMSSTSAISRDRDRYASTSSPHLDDGDVPSYIRRSESNASIAGHHAAGANHPLIASTDEVNMDDALRATRVRLGSSEMMGAGVGASSTNYNFTPGMKSQLSSSFVDNIAAKTRNKDLNKGMVAVSSLRSSSSNSAAQSPSTKNPYSFSQILAELNDVDSPQVMNSGESIQATNLDLVLNSIDAGGTSVSPTKATDSQAQVINDSHVEGSTPSSERDELFQVRSGTSSGPASSSSSKKELESFMNQRHEPCSPLKDGDEDNMDVFSLEVEKKKITDGGNVFWPWESYAEFQEKRKRRTAKEDEQQQDPPESRKKEDEDE